MEICPRCAEDEYLRLTIDVDGSELLSCDNAAHEPYTWKAHVDGPGKPARDGLGEELGLYDDLLELLVPGEPIVEYGIVEHRYACAHPNEYAVLVARYGHRAIEPSRYTASKFIARALGILRSEGALYGRFVPATGRWDYLGQVSAWAVPAPHVGDASEVLSWEEFARNDGIEPRTWPATDKLVGP